MPPYQLIPDLGDFHDNIDDVDQSAFDYIWNRRRALFLSVCLASVAICVGLWSLEIIYYTRMRPRPDAGAVLYPLAAFLLPVGLYQYFRAQLQHLFMQQIAAAIGFRYQPTGRLHGLQAKFFQLGTSPRAEDVLAGLYRGCPIEIFNYSFSVQHGRSSHTEHYTIFALTFDGVLPDIALTPKSSLALPDLARSNSGAIASAPDADVEITLEGDFNEHFQLYAPETFEVEIREIFQPDLMAELVEKYRSYRIEICGSRIYVVSPLICNKAKFLAAHDLIDRLFDRVLPNLQAVTSEPAPA